MASFYEFADYVRFDGRFVFEGKALDFLQDLVSKATQRLVSVSEYSVLYRAQINSLDDCKVVYPDSDPVNVTLPADRMIPNPALVGDGRLNPRGIAYLYLADSPETAIAEMRPGKGAYVTVASFVVAHDVQVVDLTFRKGQESVWSDVDFSISIPTTPGESWRSYLPTQCIAEFFRLRGFSGVKYRSVMSKSGYNVALFDVDHAAIQARHLYSIKDVCFESERIADPNREV